MTYYDPYLRLRGNGPASRASTHRHHEASRCPLPQASGGVFIPGPGSILSAQAQCSDALLWRDIAPCLPAVTGVANAKQTTDYGMRIGRRRIAMAVPCRWAGHIGGCRHAASN
jgi:hypothetical protein